MKYTEDINSNSQPFRNSCADSKSHHVLCYTEEIIHLVYFLPSEMFQFSKKDKMCSWII